MKKSLESPEWLLLFSLFCFICSLFVVAQVNYRKTVSHIVIPSDPAPVSVTLFGAVQKPGTYSIPSGTLVHDLIRRARPKKFAKLPEENTPILESGELYIQELSEIVITITGAIAEPLTLSVPVGTRVCDLKQRIFLSDEADPKFLKKKRVLKHKEILEIPKKRGVKNPLLQEGVANKSVPRI